jgi:hypothetical protein
MSNQVNEQDKWEVILEEQIVVLQNCQKERNLRSCTTCKFIINCETRKGYIKAVYESMSKGNGGGFEF